MASAGYWLAAGWLNSAQMSEASHAIENFTRQSDMVSGRVWQRPDNEADVLSPVGEYVDSIDFQRGGYGGVEFTWKMRGLTPEMVAYLRTTFFGTGYSAQVTARTFNRSTGDFEFYQCWAHWPDVRDAAEPAMGGYDNLVIKFLDGTTAEAGPDMTVSNVHSGTPVINTNTTWTIIASNNGDGPTFANVVLVDTLHANLDFVSTTAAGWTVEYSTNGGGAYQSTIPSPPNTTTNVRYTYTPVVNAGAAAPTITLVAAPVAVGTMNNSVTVSTTGDTNAGNDTATDTFEVGIVRDNQIAFLKGRVLASDNQAAYLSGV